MLGEIFEFAADVLGTIFELLDWGSALTTLSLGGALMLLGVGMTIAGVIVLCQAGSAHLLMSGGLVGLGVPITVFGWGARR